MRSSRATWLSLKSFAGRLVFAGALWIGAINTTDAGQMPYDDIARILTVAAFIGLAGLAMLALSARKIGINPTRPKKTATR